MIVGLENEPPPPGVDADAKKKEPELEEGETKEGKNGQICLF